jgi:hypothetical protein
MLKVMTSAGILALAALTIPSGAAFAKSAAHVKQHNQKNHQTTPATGKVHGQRGGAVLKVVSVDTTKNTITATTPNGKTTVTVTVTGSTKYLTLNKQAASLNSLGKGTLIAVAGQRTGTNAITATIVAIIPPVASGKVGTVDAAHGAFTVAGKNGTQTVDTSAATKYFTGKTAATFAAVVPNARVIATGTLNSDGSLQATTVEILPAQTGTGRPQQKFQGVAGKVTKLGTNGVSFVVTPLRPNSAPVTVTTTKTTTYAAPGKTPVSFNSIKVGTYVAAAGTLSADGKTLTATKVFVLPVGAGSKAHTH